MNAKPVIRGDVREVTYSREHWKLLQELRSRAAKIMESLEREGLSTIVHGSIARGDIKKNSDIDIVIPYPVPSFKVEIALERYGYNLQKREIVQATPAHAIKAHIYIDERTVVTFPLVELTRTEREFYKFGGELSLKELLKGIRVPGVNKNLLLIIPTSKGHIEMPVMGREPEVAKIIGVSINIVNERVRILTRRDQIGRTGVYLKRELAPNEAFEKVLREIALKDPAVRRRIKGLNSI